MDLDSVSIVSGPLPIVVIALGLVSIPASVGWRARRKRSRSRDAADAAGRDGATAADWSVATVRRRAPWRRQLLIGVPIVGALVGLTAVLVDGLALIPYQFPNSYYLWVGLVLLAIVFCLLGWGGAPWWRRLISVLSVVLTVAMAFTLINEEYAYWPNVGALFGKEAQHQVDSAELKAAQAAYKKTHQLPAQGFTIELPIPGKKSRFPAKNAYIWVPPAWVVAPTPHLPVIELLHGYPGDPSDWTRAGFADQTASTYAAAHDGVAPIIVMPDILGATGSDTECVDSPRGNAETYLTVDVPAFVHKTFLSKTGADSWAVGGFSAGGMCALMLGLRHPDIYSTFADWAGLTSPTVGETVVVGPTVQQLFGGSMQAYQEHDPLWLLQNRRFPDTAGWFEVGTDDPAPSRHNMSWYLSPNRPAPGRVRLRSPGAIPMPSRRKHCSTHSRSWRGAWTPPPSRRICRRIAAPVDCCWDFVVAYGLDVER
jgi:S-formylglutathione hydrolase FrmB